MKYTAVIRTLGKAGKKYQMLLDSLLNQSVLPEKILVYIAEGYQLPIETCGKEEYIYVPKGMVTQRALKYNEVQTEYILFLDDDLYLPPTFVEDLFDAMANIKADIMSPDIYPNHSRPFCQELTMLLSGRMRARRFRDKWGYKVMRTGGYSYKKTMSSKTYRSQTNAGACFLCRKKDFLSINFEDELWLDKVPYPIGEDQVMFYKMHLSGLKVYTMYGSGIIHLDSGGNLNSDREIRLLYSDLRFKMVFWHRFLWSADHALGKFLDALAFGYYLMFTFAISALKLQKDALRTKRRAFKETISFLKSEDYKKLPKVRRYGSHS